MSARIRVGEFQPSRTQRRIGRRNAQLRRLATSAWATEEQFDLFRRYLDERHADGGMADMDIFEFAAMIEETPSTAERMGSTIRLTTACSATTTWARARTRSRNDP